MVRHRMLASAFALGMAVVAFGPLGAADDATPGNAGMTKIAVYDETNDVWNVLSGTPDPVIGFVNFRPPVPGDASTLRLVVSLKGAAPQCNLAVELVTGGVDPSGGLPADGAHFGFINVVGEIVTNAQGNGNTGMMAVDVTGLAGIDPTPGVVNYAHVDLEDHEGDCVEADGTGVGVNEYGASSSVLLPSGGTGTILHWTQP